MPEIIAQITAPHFCAGIVMRGDRCTEAAPILAWAVGKTRAELRRILLGRDGGRWSYKRKPPTRRPAADLSLRAGLDTGLDSPEAAAIVPGPKDRVCSWRCPDANSTYRGACPSTLPQRREYTLQPAPTQRKTLGR